MIVGSFVGLVEVNVAYALELEGKSQEAEAGAEAAPGEAIPSPPQ